MCKTCRALVLEKLKELYPEGEVAFENVELFSNKMYDTAIHTIVKGKRTLKKKILLTGGYCSKCGGKLADTGGGLADA